MIFDRKTISAVYSSCALLFGMVLITQGSQNLEQPFLYPLDTSHSILGSKSVFREYLGKKKVYAFLPYWSVGDTTPYLGSITDLSYFGLTVNSKGRLVTTDGPYKIWRQDKILAKTIKAVTKAGGRASLTLICHDDSDIDKLLACGDCWESLAQDVIAELSWAKIADLNVDFEYSGYTTPENAKKYSELVGLLNTRLDAAFGESFVVVSTYADAAEKADKEDVRLTDPKSLAVVADAVFIMAYDFHRPTSDNAGPVSPLDGSYSTTRLNLTKTLASYLKVVPASKLILGLPLYGYDWLVEGTDPMSGRVEGNDAIGYSKSRTYVEITNLLVKKQIKPLWDEESKTPYFNYIDEETGMKRQIWYDNSESLSHKVNLAVKNSLLGTGIWALGFEGGYTDILEAFKPRT